MSNPNGPSIEEQEEWADELRDRNEAWLAGKRSTHHKLDQLLRRWEESLKAFTSPFYTVDKPMEATMEATMEGVIFFSTTQWLAIAALAVLVAINGIATATNLIADRKMARRKK